MKNSSQQGFSLVELMIVVGIAGILAAVAIPNFKKFADRARHAQAKTALASIYEAETVFNAEFQGYTSRLNAIGYAPEGVFHYNIGFGSDFPPPPTATTQGSSNCLRTCPMPASCGGKPICYPSANYDFAGSNIPYATATTFLAQGHSHFNDNDVTIDDVHTWVIDHRKYLRETNPE